MHSQPEIVAAGAVVTRKSADGVEVLLVHRPKYDDWSFPKGKVDPGEHVLTAAVREVLEETGLHVRLGPPLGTQRYLASNGRSKIKDVHYWAGYVLGDDNVSTYSPNAEIDDVAWVPVNAARERLTYRDDLVTMEAFQALPRRTYPLIVLRHAKALSRKDWDGNDRQRTLSPAGGQQAEELVPLLGAYDVQRIVTSSSRRCAETVLPYADAAGLILEETDELSQEDATASSVSAHVQKLLAGKEPAVLCTHRPVLPWTFEALGLEQRKLETASLFVAHHRRGKVVAVEQHDLPAPETAD